MSWLPPYTREGGESIRSTPMACYGFVAAAVSAVGVSGGADMWIPGPERAASLDRFRLRCEQYKTLGLNRVYTPSGTRRAVTADDFAETPRCIREVGDIAQEFELTAMIEFIRAVPVEPPAARRQARHFTVRCRYGPAHPSHSQTVPTHSVATTPSPALRTSVSGSVVWPGRRHLL